MKCVLLKKIPSSLEFEYFDTRGLFLSDLCWMPEYLSINKLKLKKCCHLLEICFENIMGLKSSHFFILSRETDWTHSAHRSLSTKPSFSASTCNVSYQETQFLQVDSTSLDLRLLMSSPRLESTFITLVQCFYHSAFCCHKFHSNKWKLPLAFADNFLITAFPSGLNIEESFAILNQNKGYYFTE